ncbi:carbohydrate kinase family protein [Streptomyces rimosus]|uniref:carbohydrate kinase family protein n=1 Tax=Streptomyces rimosus TaxID=1927 RepID=UPI000AE8B888|nr:PfkB family carbohydrate kinase [Streptomyces rimosus]
MDILVSSADELALCLPSGSPADITTQARELLAAGVSEVVVKLGPGGATSHTPPEPHPANLSPGPRPTADTHPANTHPIADTHPAERPSCPHDAVDGSLHQPAVPVRAVDPVGAGDAFAVGYLPALLDGEGVAGCLERAVITGAFAVAFSGDWEGAVTRAELHLLGAPPGTVVR